jgi:NAD(P)-dependent dehydrogenase (short-subunit alcohol dehydrogenase family)
VVGGGQADYGMEDAPTGNGRAMCELFAREGAAVAIGDIDEPSARRTAELVRAAEGTAHVLLGDASDEEQITAMVRGAAEALGGLDGLVMCVGIGAGMGIRGTTAEDWDKVMAVNLRAHFLGCKLALEAMAQSGGAVVLLGSVAAYEVLPFPAYGASKLALESLCRQAAVEGAPGVRVNVLHPGLIDTALGRMASKLNPRREQVRIPAGRQGTSREVAAAALFLLSDDASYVTGQALVVDGGLTVASRA